MKEILKQIPKTDKLLNAKALSGYNPNFLKPLIQRFLKNYRESLLKGGEVLSFESCVEQISKEYWHLSQKSLKPLINATGVIIHTNLGRSVFSKELLQEIFPTLIAYNNLEYNQQTGKRGERYAHLKKFLTSVDFEDILIVNNNAAAVFLIFNTFAKNKEVLVSRGELIEIGGSFRIPRVMEDSGAILKEIGTTNKTYLQDYQEAINENTAMLFKAHKSNYEIVGFHEEVAYEDLIKLARDRGVVDYYDLGSGYFEIKGLETLKNFEPSLQEIAALKPSLISFSGDKLLGGTQAGIILGKKQYIAKLKQNQLLRMLRVDKFTLCALEALFCAYLKGEYEKIPTARMLLQTKEALETKAKNLLAKIPAYFSPKILPTKGYVGGGAMPNRALDSYGVALKPKNTTKNIQSLEELLRQEGIVARIENECLILDVMALFESDFEAIKNALLKIK
ncbi:L-seryl-tRNA(Sec) selenium transferase [Helicobacter mesocricetorum]|uniref:L-seryl-tRNA(Sec) selenium transferase n=1 Tax=Helicobacter mesocricetorum TaxID=87012 RepID=UPI000CF0CE97|nr:L-seryl-tRNA(Sec) selenium transferase [Helicobacter mesocricetorum]